MTILHREIKMGSTHTLVFGLDTPQQFAPGLREDYGAAVLKNVAEVLQVGGNPAELAMYAYRVADQIADAAPRREPEQRSNRLLRNVQDVLKWMAVFAAGAVAGWQVLP